MRAVQSARAVGPLIATLSTSPLRSALESAGDALRGATPSLVRQVTPLVEQFPALGLDVSQVCSPGIQCKAPAVAIWRPWHFHSFVLTAHVLDAHIGHMRLLLSHCGSSS